MTDGLEAAREAVFGRFVTSMREPNIHEYRVLDAFEAKVREDERTEMVKKAIAMGMHEPADCPGESALRAAADVVCQLWEAGADCDPAVQALREVLNGSPSPYGTYVDGYEAGMAAAHAGAPWEPSDQMVRRAELAVRLEFAKVQVDAINVARAALRAAFGGAPQVASHARVHSAHEGVPASGSAPPLPMLRGEWRAERAYEAAGRAEAPDADEEVLRLKLLSHVDAESRPRALELLEALIAYRERRLREVIRWAIEFIRDRQVSTDEEAYRLEDALRALSERSDGDA